MFFSDSNKRGGACSGLPHSSSLFICVGFCSSISKSTSYLAVLCKVQSGNFLCLFNLFFVALDLELVNQSLHTLMILLILITSKCELLNRALRLAEILADVSIASALCIQLRFQFSDAGFHLNHGLASSF